MLWLSRNASVVLNHLRPFAVAHNSSFKSFPVTVAVVLPPQESLVSNHLRIHHHSHHRAQPLQPSRAQPSSSASTGQTKTEGNSTREYQSGITSSDIGRKGVDYRGPFEPSSGGSKNFHTLFFFRHQNRSLNQSLVGSNFCCLLFVINILVCGFSLVRKCNGK